MIVSGDAPGVDALAARYAQENIIEPKIFFADWDRYGRSAGPKRNTYIVNMCSHMIAFPSVKGKGTQDSINKAQKASRIIEIVFIDK